MGVETLVVLAVGLLCAMFLILIAVRLIRKSKAGRGNLIEIDENVQITVYRRPVVKPDVWYPLLAFAHLTEPRPDTDVNEPDPLQEVRRQAQQMLGQHAEAFQSLTSDSRSGVARQGELRFVPRAEGIEFNPAERRFIWSESVHCEPFRMRAAASADGKTVRGELTVFAGSLLVADVPLKIRVDKDSPETAEEKAQARPYRKIFASYSHRDLGIVQEFERHARATGDSYLRDVASLRSGERWNDQILDMINRADVFQLFWSWNAMASPFVCKEWEYALSLNRSHFVRPVYWDDPLPERPGLPPDSLRRLHFQRVYPQSRSSDIEERPRPHSRRDRPRGSSVTRVVRAAAIVAPVLALALYVVVLNRSQSVPPPAQSVRLPAPGPKPAPPVVVPAPAPLPPLAGRSSNTPPPPAPPVSKIRRDVAELQVAELVAFREIIRVQGELAGLVEGTDGEIYTLRVGDRVLDGFVRSIDADGIVFVQESRDPQSPVEKREVRRALNPR